MYTLNSTFDQLDGYLFSSIPVSNYTPFRQDLGFYKKQFTTSKQLNLSAPGLFVIADQWIHLWRPSYDGTTPREASFNVIFNMSVPAYLVSDCLIFTVIPQDFMYGSYAGNLTMVATPIELIGCSCNSTSKAIVDASLGANRFIIRADEVNSMIDNDTVICVQIAIEHLGAGDSSTANYSFSIQYNPLVHNLVVQVEAADGQQGRGNKPGINFSNTSSSSQYVLFSFSSSMGQLFQLHTLNLTIESLYPQKKGNTTIILSSVLGSAAATMATAAAVYFYFNSKYRGWKKELDQLAKTMQLLPGVPTQFSFSDIRRATNNFHETTKLGRGGFGAVYRCRLPGRKKGEALEVAVKKFSRDDNRRYEDFLAEVSVINRLRHKNIVPLVGWSYNKGEPLLIYEYMPNGSLDQHLFGRSGVKHQQETQINRWDTRYNMVKDIATGLHYVHHEYEPRVLHRDIKANNIMIDSTFQGRLGDFGLACVMAEGKESYTDIGAPGTLGFRAPEYIHSGKATTKSDIFAFGVLVLEIVTGKTAVDAQHRHLADWVWHLHKEGRILDAIDPLLATEFHPSDGERLLLLGLACSQPNPPDRPTMVEALRVITKSESPPDVPLEKPRFVWPPPEEGQFLSSDDCSTELSSLMSGGLTTIGIEMTERGGQASSSENGGNNSSQSHHRRPIAGPSQEPFSIYHTAA